LDVAALLVAASLAGGHAVLLGQLGCCYAGAAVAVVLRAAYTFGNFGMLLCLCACVGMLPCELCICDLLLCLTYLY